MDGLAPTAWTLAWIIAIPFLTAGLIAALYRPALRVGLVDHPDFRKHHGRPVPLVGGPAMTLAFAIALAAGGAWSGHYNGLLAALGLVFVVGLIDDRLGLPVLPKCLVQIAVAVMLVEVNGLSIEHLGAITGGSRIGLGDWSGPFTVVCVVGLINAINMIDGLDGLAGGVAGVILSALAVFAFDAGGAELAMGPLLLLGALLGFLLFNFPGLRRQRPRVFMGDSGSMMLGIAIAWFALDIGYHPGGNIPPMAIAWVLALPVVETVILIGRRLAGRRHPMSADREHLHHLCERAGLSPTATVWLLITLTAATAGIGLLGWALGLPEPWLFGGFLALLGVHLLLVHFAEPIAAWIRTHAPHTPTPSSSNSTVGARAMLDTTPQPASAAAGADVTATGTPHSASLRQRDSDPHGPVDDPGIDAAAHETAAATRKLVFVNRFFYPDESATSRLLSDLAFHLAEQGFHVHVVTSRIDYQAGGRPLPAEETIAGVRIHRCWTTSLGRNTLYGRALDYLFFYLTATGCLLHHVARGDLVIAKTDPPLISVPAAMVCRLKRARLVNWVQDLFPEIATAAGIPGARGPLAWLTRAARNWSYRQAGKNVALGTAMADRLQANGIAASRIEIIPNWADGAQIRPVPPEANRLRREWGLTDKFVVEYSGNLGRAHDAETLLDGARQLSHRDDIRFLFIGGGVRLAWLKQRVQELQLDNILFKEYQPRERLDESLGVGDVHLVSLRPEMEGLVFPSKLYGAFAAARPVIHVGDAVGDVARFVEAHGCGWSVPSGEAGTLAERIEQITGDTDTRALASTAARDIFRAKLDRPHALEHWRVLLQGAF